MKDSDKLKKAELKILDKLDQLCKENDLKYYLAYGSALGAVRHGGFIPWDDDIDVYMDIKDYLKLRDICRRNLDKEFYYQDKLTDKYYFNPWARLGLENTTSMSKDRLTNHKSGICIDIFWLVPLKDSEKNRKYVERYIKLMNITCSKYYVLNTNQAFYKKLIHMLISDRLNTSFYELALKKLTKFIDDYDCLMTNDVASEKNYYYYRNDIEGNRTILFENRQIPIVNNFDKYLTSIYGDYMTPPPMNERYGHDKEGDSIIYDFNKSYVEYQREIDIKK